MTRSEFVLDEENVKINGSVDIVNERPVYTYKTTVNSTTYEIIGRFPLNGNTSAERLHKKAIQWALSEGLAIPEEVLNDYPELKPVIHECLTTEPIPQIELIGIPEQLQKESTSKTSDLSNVLNIAPSIEPKIRLNGQETKETRQIRHVITQSKYRIAFIPLKHSILFPNSGHTPRREKSHPVCTPEYFDSC